MDGSVGCDMSLAQTGIRVLCPRRQRADGGHDMIVEICVPAGSPGWVFQVAFDTELVLTANARLPLLPEARALCLVLQSGWPWAMADSETHGRSCQWWEKLHPQGKPALTDSFAWSFRQHFPAGSEFGNAAHGRAGLDAEQFKSLLQRTVPATRGHKGVTVDLMRTTFVAQPLLEELVTEAKAAGMREGGVLAMQQVNNAIAQAAARGAAGGRSDTAYISGARALTHDGTGARRQIFGMKQEGLGC